MPHEADAKTCPITRKAIAPRRVSTQPPAAAHGDEASYQWAHSIHPFSLPRDEESSSMPAVDPRAMVGQTVERKYKIEALIGQGGMGAVYRAENVRLGKHVAIKILMRGYARGGEHERRFLREARIAGSIGHPNIVEVFDLGTLENGAPFQVMELLEGQTLASRIKIEGALPIDEVLEIAEQVLSALAAAHERGIVHRDLKPENVFLQVRPRAITKLLDFGVSKSLLGDQTLSITKTGMIVGTPYYLAPEQARAERTMDHRVDVWGMGVVLYEALTGWLPFRADEYEALIRKILQNDPIPLTTLRPAVSYEVEALVMRALAFDPDDRYQTAADMLKAIRRARGMPSDRPVFRDGREARDSLPTETWSTDPEDAGDPTEISDRFVFEGAPAGHQKKRS
jgi:serine/threonine protein kinase